MKFITLPANLILMRSKGCKIRVDATPPDMPATRCSYFTWLRTVIFRLGDAPPVAFIVVISCPALIFLDLYCRTDESFCWFWLELFVTSSCISHTLARVVTKYTLCTIIKKLTQLFPCLTHSLHRQPSSHQWHHHKNRYVSYQHGKQANIYSRKSPVSRSQSHTHR